MYETRNPRSLGETADIVTKNGKRRDGNNNAVRFFYVKIHKFVYLINLRNVLSIAPNLYSSLKCNPRLPGQNCRLHY